MTEASFKSSYAAPAQIRSGLLAADNVRPSALPLPVRPKSQTADLAAELARAAQGEDLETSAIAASVAQLHDSGYLGAEPVPTRTLVRRLITVGEANLPVARLYEGHVNALRLLLTLGDRQAQAQARDDAAQGSLLGVWGANGERPLAVEGGALVGSKRFASGLGTVRRAIVTVGEGESARLGVLDVSDPPRHRADTWNKTGMRATASGDFVFDGIPVSAVTWIGAPGEYFDEPGFVGGVWRIAAVQLGGTLGLLKTAAGALAKIGRLHAEPQVARLTPVLTRALAAGAFVDHAACVAEGAAGLAEPERAVSLSAQARLLTEEIGQDAIAAVERSVGLPHFDETAPTGRIARDLATYMRQAARDALLQRAGIWALQQDGPYSALLPEEADPDA